MLSMLEEVIGNEIIRIFGKFFLSKGDNKVRDGAGIYEEEKQPTYKFEHGMEALQEDADFKYLTYLFFFEDGHVLNQL